MRYSMIVLFLFCFSGISPAWGQAELDLPIRINCGGREVIDSEGNVWLADEGVNLDPLNIVRESSLD